MYFLNLGGKGLTSDATHRRFYVYFGLKPFHSQENFPCSLARNIISPSSELTWLFIAYSDERWLYYQISLSNLYISPLGDWENLLIGLGSERVKHPLAGACSRAGPSVGKTHASRTWMRITLPIILPWRIYDNRSVLMVQYFLFFRWWVTA